MRSFMTKAVLGATLAATAMTVAAPAEAQRYYRHRHDGDTTGAAILGGIVGLGVGAAIASSSRDRYYRGGYYDRGYYNDGYYDRGYYDAPRRYYRPRCYSQWRYDPYYGDRVRVRVCR